MKIWSFQLTNPVNIKFSHTLLKYLRFVVYEMTQILKANFKGQIWPWFQWKYEKNIKSHHAFVKWYSRPMFDAWLLTFVD